MELVKSTLHSLTIKEVIHYTGLALRDLRIRWVLVQYHPREVKKSRRRHWSMWDMLRLGLWSR